jgi:hypothetical protein
MHACIVIPPPTARPWFRQSRGKTAPKRVKRWCSSVQCSGSEHAYWKQDDTADVWPPDLLTHWELLSMKYLWQHDLEYRLLHKTQNNDDNAICNNRAIRMNQTRKSSKNPLLSYFEFDAQGALWSKSGKVPAWTMHYYFSNRGSSYAVAKGKKIKKNQVRLL